MATDTQFSNYYAELSKILHLPRPKKELAQIIVDAPFHNKLHTTTLDLGMISLMVINKKTGTIDYNAISDTDPARGSSKMSPIPFNQVKIPLDYKSNCIVTAIKTGKLQKTSDWKQLFAPALSAESARFNQTGGGIACSFVQPLTCKNGGGAMIFSYYQSLDDIDNDIHHRFMSKYTELVSEVIA